MAPLEARELRLHRLQPVRVREDHLHGGARGLGLQRIQPAEEDLFGLLVGRAVGRHEEQVERPLDEVLLLAAARARESRRPRG